MDEELKDVEKELRGQVEKRAEALNTDLCLHTIPCDGSQVGLIRMDISKKLIWVATQKFDSTKLFQHDSLILRLKANCFI